MDDSGDTYLCDMIRTTGAGVAPPPSASPDYPMYLIVLGGGIPGAMLRLSPGGTRLGRAADNTVQLPDASISRYHAFLGLDEEGQVRLTDLGSTNGYVPQRPEAPREHAGPGLRTATGSSSAPP